MSGVGIFGPRIGEPLALLVTCAIRPHAAIPAAVSDPTLRLAEVVESLAGWRSFAEHGPVVVAESSAFPEQAFRAAAARVGATFPYSFMSAPTSTTAALNGRGAAELELINAALGLDRDLAYAGHVLKTAGRQVIRGRERLVAGLRRRLPLADVHANLHADGAFADARLFAFRPRFLRISVNPLASEISERDGILLDHILARAVYRHRVSGGTWRMLPGAVRVSGVSGETGTPYPDSVVGDARVWVKHRLRVALAPRVGRA